MMVGGILSQVWVEKEKWKMTNLKNDDCVLEWKNGIHLGQLSGWTICFFLYVDSDFSETHREILKLRINICKFMINETKQP